MDPVFHYDEDYTWENNYHRWRTMNNDERFRHNLKEYTEDEAIELFTKMYPKSKIVRALKA